MAELEIRSCGSQVGELCRKEKTVEIVLMVYTILILILVYLIAKKKKG